MSTCGYICPKCGGSLIDEDGNPCNWCIQEPKFQEINKNTEEQINEWIKSVHEGKCCADD